MEKLKFRGRKTTSKEWVYGNLSVSKSANPIISQIQDKSILMPNGFIAGWAYEVQKESVSPFIGLSDTNKIQLYLGDIIEFDYCGTTLRGIISLDKYNHSMILVEDKEYHIENVKRSEKLGTIYDQIKQNV